MSVTAPTIVTPSVTLSMTSWIDVEHVADVDRRDVRNAVDEVALQRAARGRRRRRPRGIRRRCAACASTAGAGPEHEHEAAVLRLVPGRPCGCSSRARAASRPPMSNRMRSPTSTCASVVHHLLDRHLGVDAVRRRGRRRAARPERRRRRAVSLSCERVAEREAELARQLAVPAHVVRRRQVARGARRRRRRARA